jgi:hypothetical protein
MFSFAPILFKRKVSETKLTVTITNGKPIELIDFTESFVALGQQYKKYSWSNYSSTSSLYIKEVRPGSTIIELMEHTKVALLPLFGDVNTIIEYTKFLQKGYDFLLGKWQDITEPRFTISELEALSKILKPPANNTVDSSMKFEVHDNGKMINHFSLGNTEANAIQNQAAKEIKRLEETTPSHKDNVVFYWYIAKNDLKSKRGEKGIIESISRYPIKTMFKTQEIKSAMIYPPEHNIFDLGFIVDVNIETVDGGKPILYTITNFYDYIVKKDEENP